ncbi:hypothetical protein EJ05DRAFT_479989 [Pseudovirgaria hyperparasitica]|uniref:Uncharacterized protein n=1 Tax=Pseudovirgaria hyperparasitica TaxID=470096 RepID=A0A6A6VUY1_9PEZI|nr:uncharacterized protein EJ05DRAFT_479989 [Pseudovirgaria hyperparasitica]KAF2753975.1 hypothetical protein EJ05DRAFT_479989 [Pseudovirgaria hyperparasitica]
MFKATPTLQMFKPTASLLTAFKSTPTLQAKAYEINTGSWRKFIPLTPKKGNKYFYKGNKVGSHGSFQKGHNVLQKRRVYRVDYSKVRTYVVPDLNGCRLTPFTSKLIEHPRDMPKEPGEGSDLDPIKGEAFLQLWRDLNRDGT